MNNTAVIYHYFEKDTTYQDNLIFFLSVGIQKNIDYFVVISGPCSVQLPELPNIKYIHTENWNNDFGGYIRFLESYFPGQHSYYIFINSSVRGPFMADHAGVSWTQVFTDYLKENTHLVGPTINLLPVASKHSLSYAQKYGATPPFNHVQTSAYALTKQAVQHLVDIGFYNIHRELRKDEVIDDYELRLSQEILKNNWAIQSFFPIYNDLMASSATTKYPSFSAVKGDVMYRQAFFGRSLSPTESVFVKVNRNMVGRYELASHTFTALHAHRADFQTAASQDLLDRSYVEAQKNTPLKLKIRKFFNPAY